jgi:hypothetical protein
MGEEMKAFRIWYEAGYQSWKFAGTYNAATEAEAIAKAKADGLAWATVIASDTNPNQAATQRRGKVKDAQAARRSRQTQAANRLGAKTIDRFVTAVLALSDEDAATLRAHFEDVTQKT